MPKVSIILVIYNAKKFIKPVFDSIFSQTHKNFDVLAVINGSEDGSKEEIRLNYPQVRIIDPHENLWFAKGNNLGIRETDGEFVLLVNQDMVLEPDFIEKLLPAFDDWKVAAASGKILRYDFEHNQKTKIIDTVGVTMSSSGRGKDRGQLEEDRGQYENIEQVFGVSGACPMYRRSALEKVQYVEHERVEYYDEDFVAYWEDVDLSWRFNNAGMKSLYVPQAVAYHGRTAGQSKGGYLHLFHFIRHHKKISPAIRRMNYRNHILMYLKNSKFIHPLFIIREILMFGYVLVFETSTLKVLPDLFRLMPRMYKKRRAALHST
ncbi:MAG TPA: glycosyltransferase family 2 protein [Candidatus Binatia bacterium]|nr:glycosyltransferase family 2 protein [Candidatus Binatia bacterium]